MFYKIEIAVYLYLRERICSPKEFAPLRISVSLCLQKKKVVYSF